jgi:hypothetical protein
MRFKPSSSGKTPKNVVQLALNQLDDPEREMVSDTVFDARHEAEILKAENKSAGVKEVPPTLHLHRVRNLPKNLISLFRCRNPSPETLLNPSKA